MKKRKKVSTFLLGTMYFVFMFFVLPLFFFGVLSVIIGSRFFSQLDNPGVIFFTCIETGGVLLIWVAANLTAKFVKKRYYGYSSSKFILGATFAYVLGTLLENLKHILDLLSNTNSTRGLYSLVDLLLFSTVFYFFTKRYFGNQGLEHEPKEKVVDVASKEMSKKKRSETILALEFIFSINVFSNFLAVGLMILISNLFKFTSLATYILNFLCIYFGYWIAIQYYAKYLKGRYRDYDIHKFYKRSISFLILSLSLSLLISLWSFEIVTVIGLTLAFVPLLIAFFLIRYLVKKYVVGMNINVAKNLGDKK